MAKTAMQAMVDYLENRSKDRPFLPVVKELNAVISTAKGLIEKEREQIEEAYNYGYRDGINTNERYESYSGSDNYYNSKYGSKLSPK